MYMGINYPAAYFVSALIFTVVSTKYSVWSKKCMQNNFSMMNEEGGWESGNVLHSIFRIKEGKVNSLIYNQDSENKLLREDRNSSCSLSVKESLSLSCQSLDDWGLTYSIYAK